MTTRKVLKSLILIFLILTTVLFVNIVYVYAIELSREDDQYMELRVTDIKDTADGDKQVMLEWWSYNLKFHGLDLRFSYDDSKVQPSSVQNNSYATDETSFEFAGDFASYMEYQIVTAQDGTYRCYMSLENYGPGTYIDLGEKLSDSFVNTNVDGGVLLGRMSFRLFNGELDETTFALKPDTHSPQTGIKISQTFDTEYTDSTNPIQALEAPLFRFSILSNDAKLTDLKYNFFNYIEENDEETMPTMADEDYSAVDLSTPDADSTEEISKYTITLNKYIDNISLKAILSHENATVKIKKQGMDSLEAWDTGQTKELKLNPLGGEDTIIDIEVTAQDGETKHTYELIIHRPYGTIKGSIQLGTDLRDNAEAKGDPFVEYIADIKAYKAGEFNWNDVFTADPNGPSILDTVLDTINIENKTESDSNTGEFELYLIPGTYDVFMEKLGFTQVVNTNIILNENDVIDIKNHILYEGDVNRDGLIDIKDITQEKEHRTRKL